MSFGRKVLDKFEWFFGALRFKVLCGLLICLPLSACTAPESLPKVETEHHQSKKWNWDVITNSYTVSFSQRCNDYLFSSFSYYLPDLPHTAASELFGYEVSKDGKTVYLEMEDSPAQHLSFQKMTDGRDSPLVDLEGHGETDLPISAFNDTGYSLRVFSIAPDFKLLGEINQAPFRFQLMSVDDGTEKMLTRLVGVSLHGESKTILVAVEHGRLRVEPYALGLEGQHILNLGRRCAVNWRMGGLWATLDLEIESCTKKIEQFPQDPAWKATRAALLTQRMLLDEKHEEAMTMALADCQSALSIEPQNALAHAVLGRLYSVQGEFKKAVEQFSQAIASQPKNPEWYAQRGLAFDGLKDFKHSSADYQAELSLDPSSNWASSALAQARLHTPASRQ